MNKNTHFYLVALNKRIGKLHTFLPLKRMVIVTFDEEETINLDDDSVIEVIPAWKWLLE